MERALELEPQDRLSRIVLSETYARLGREKDAVALLDRPEFRNDWPMGFVYALSGRRAEALKIAQGISKLGSYPDPSMRYITSTPPRRCVRFLVAISASSMRIIR